MLVRVVVPVEVGSAEGHEKQNDNETGSAASSCYAAQRRENEDGNHSARQAKRRGYRRERATSNPGRRIERFRRLLETEEREDRKEQHSDKVSLNRPVKVLHLRRSEG